MGGAKWRNLKLFFARAKAVGRIAFALRATLPEEKFEVSPLRSAHLSASASVEMTGFFRRVRALQLNTSFL